MADKYKPGYMGEDVEISQDGKLVNSTEQEKPEKKPEKVEK